MSPAPIDYDALVKLLRERRSVRRFDPGPLAPEVLEQLVEAARWAPSAGNRQSYRFYAVTSKTILLSMAQAVREASERLRASARLDLQVSVNAYLTNFAFFDEAPAVLVPIYRGGPDMLARASGDAGGREGQGERDALASVSAAIMNLLLAAHALGLGACWMTGPLVASEELKRILAVPEGWQIAAFVPVGRPAEQPHAPPRRDVQRLLQRLD